MNACEVLMARYQLSAEDAKAILSEMMDTRSLDILADSRLTYQVKELPG